jgi:hypothetical protein
MRGRVPRGVTAAAALLLVASACARPDGSAPAPGSTEAGAAPGATSPVAPASPTTPDPVAPDPAAPETGPRTCDPSEATGMVGTVAAQLDALGAGDFTSAYGWASPFFRRLVTAEAFEALIRDGYPELLDVAARRFEGCSIRGRRGTLVVAITARSGARRVLAYELGEEADGWRIDGAGDIEPPRPAGSGSDV